MFVSQIEKDNFLQTELGLDLRICIDTIDKLLPELYNPLFADNYHFYLGKLEVFKLLLKQLFGVEYCFSRTDDYYGLVIDNQDDWLYKVERKL